MNPSSSPEIPKITPNLVTPDSDGAGQPGASPSGPPLKVKKRSKFWKGLGLTLLIGGAASGAYLTQTKHGQQIVQDTKEMIPTARDAFVAYQNPGLIFDHDKSDVVNILLVGRDQNYKQVYDKQGRNIAHVVDHDTPARSDTMIIVSLDRSKKTIRMVSLPRDALVHMPENKYDVRLAKLNAAHAYGGVALLEKTLHDELGITIHHHAVIKFDGFMKLIDEVDGVYVDVIGALKRDGTRGNLRYTDSWAIPPLDINLKPGKQWLSGEQAHAYVRFRMDLEGDTGRIRRQQAVMRALASRLKQINPARIPGVMKMIREQFETDMDDSLLASAGFFAQSLGETTKMQPITLYGSYTERGAAKLNRKRNKALLHAIFGPTFNPENFLQNSPTVRGYEFGPDETKPDTRAILREAGLIEGEPRIATGAEGEEAQGALSPSGFPSTPTAPLTLEPGAASVLPTARDPFAFTSPEGSAGSNEGAEPGRGGEPRGEVSTNSGSNERPRRRRTRRTAEEAQAQSGESPSTSPAESAAQSPIPQPEGSQDSGDLSVESPIPQPEN